MSKKRFERWNDHSCKVKDNQEGTFLSWEDVVYKLNKQQDIIGEQKIAIDELVTDYKKLEKENEQLKQYNTELVDKIDFLERIIDGDVECLKTNDLHLLMKRVTGGQFVMEI